MTKRIFAVLIAAFVAFGTVTYEASPLPVARIGTSEFDTLEAAVEAATEGDTVVLLADAELAAPLVVEKAVTITTEGGAEGGAVISLAGEKLTGNLVDLHAAVRIAGTAQSPITLTGKGSVSTTSGLLYIRSDGTEIDYVIFRDNTVTRNNGAGARVVGEASFDHCGFIDLTDRDTERSGAAAYINRDCDFTDCSFTRCSAANLGGAVCVTGGAAATFLRCGFESCSAGVNGGAIYGARETSVTLTGCTANACSAGGSGGVTYSAQSAITADNCTFTGNTDVNGLGSCIRSTGSVAVASCSFGGNGPVAVGANAAGSGLYARSIENCSFDCAPSLAHSDVTVCGAQVTGSTYELALPTVRDGYGSFEFDGSVIAPDEYIDGYFAEAMTLDITRNGAPADTVQLSGVYAVHITLAQDCYFDSAHTLTEADLGFEITSSQSTAAVYMQAEVSDTVAVIFSMIPSDDAQAAEFNGYESIVLRAGLGGNADVREIAGEKTAGSDTWVFRFDGVRAQCMSDIIWGRFVGLDAAGTETELGTAGAQSLLTVADYCESVAALNSENVKLLALMADMLAYGGAAQRYVSYNTADQADSRSFVAGNRVHYDMEASATEVTVPAAVDDCRISYAALVLEGRISPQFRFFVRDLTNIQVAIEGPDGTPKLYGPADMAALGGDEYSLTFDGVLPQDYGDVYTVSLSRGGTVLHAVSFSVNSYLAAVWDAGGSLGALASAAYDYGKAAAAFTGKKSVDIYTHEDGELSIFFLEATAERGTPGETGYVHGGDSTLLISPDGKTMLIDANNNADKNNEVIAGALSALGISRLDYLVFSHPHIDHIGGYQAIFAAGVEAGKVYINDNFDYSSASSGLVTYLSDNLIPCEVLKEGDAFDFGASVRIEVLNPPADYAFDNSSTQISNNGSLLMKFVFGDSSYLTGGDIYAAQENAIVTKYGSALKADVVKMNHHGASSSNSDAWVSAVSPLVAVSELREVSSADVLERYASAGALAFNTGIDGGVAVHTSGDGRYTVVTSRYRNAAAELSFGPQDAAVPAGVTLR